MLGFRFLRQRLIDKYIVDFFCKDLNLIIELNGLTHNWEDTIEKDKAKQKDLEAMGYTILRFNDDEVTYYITNVSRVIENWIRLNYPDKVSSP